MTLLEHPTASIPVTLKPTEANIHVQTQVAPQSNFDVYKAIIENATQRLTDPTISTEERGELQSAIIFNTHMLEKHLEEEQADVHMAQTVNKLANKALR